MSNLSDDEVNKIMGVKLRGLRVKEGLSIAQVSNYTGLDSSLLSKYELGRRSVTISNLNILLTFYEISWSKFFTRFDKSYLVK